MVSWRKPTHLPHFDYSQPGAYFVTFCVNQMRCLLGNISDTQVHLTPRGEIAENASQAAEAHFALISIDSRVITDNE